MALSGTRKHIVPNLSPVVHNIYIYLRIYIYIYVCIIYNTHRIHVWYIYLHLVDFYGKMLANIPYMDPMGYTKKIELNV